MVTLNERLGRIAFNFSNLELVLSCFVTKLISDDSKIGAIVTSEMSFQNLLKAFDSLSQYKITDSEQLIAIRDLIKQINTAEQERNTVLHSAFASLDPNNTNEVIRLKVTAKQGKGLRIVSEKVDIEKLKQQSNNLVQLMIELQSIYKKLYNEDALKFA